MTQTAITESLAKSARLLLIYVLLEREPGIRTREIARRLDTPLRSIQRDLVDLRRLRPIIDNLKL